MSDEVVQLTTLESMEEFPVNQPQTSPQRIAKDILAGTTGGIARISLAIR